MQFNYRLLLAEETFFVLLLALIGFLILRGHTQPGRSRWIIANFLYAVWFPAHLLQPVLPECLFEMGANGLLIAASILYLEGIREFHALRPQSPAVTACGALVLTTVAYFCFIIPNYNARVVDMSSFWAIVAILCSFTLLQRRISSDRLISAIVAGLFALSAAINSARAVYFLFAPRLAGLPSPNPAIEAFSVASTLSILCCGLGLLMLGANRQRIRMGTAETLATSAVRKAVEAQNRAEEALIAKDEYLTLVNHEIRNPLGSILAATDFLLDTELTGEQRKYAATVRAEAENLLRVNDNLLDLSAMEAGQLKLESSPFDLRSLLEVVARRFREPAGDTNLNVIVSYPPGLPCQVIGDPARIRQVLMNLVCAAAKLVPMGQVAVAIECEACDSPHILIRVSVIREGVPFFPEEAGALLIGSRPGIPSALRAFGPAGVALAVSRKLVDSMGGRFHAANESDRNSRFGFTLTLPLAPT
jgi:signal transduction histidine kinase